MSPFASLPSLLLPEQTSPKIGAPDSPFSVLGRYKDREVSQEAQNRSRLDANRYPGILKEFSTHMKRSLAFAVSLASGLALSAAAQSPAAPPAAPSAAPAASAATAPAAPARIAVVAFQVAVAQTNEGQRNFADLQKKYDPKRQQLKALNDDIDSLTKQLQAQGDKLSEAERASRAKTIDDKKKQLQREAEDAQNDFQNEMQELYNSLASKVYDVLNSYAQQHGYTLVLDVAQQQTPVLYATESTNITKAVIDAYNVKSGVPAPPPSAMPSAPAPGPQAPKAPGVHK
jgi:outer membrane protein